MAAAMTQHSVPFSARFAVPAALAATLAGASLVRGQQPATPTLPVRVVPGQPIAVPGQPPQAAPLQPAPLQPASGQPAPGAATPEPSPPATAIAPGPGSPPTGAQDPAAAAAQQQAAAEQEKQQRLQKIQATQFDRRPATMLRTWASPKEAGVVTGDPLPPGAGATAGASGAPPAGMESVSIAFGSPTPTVLLLPTNPGATEPAPPTAEPAAGAPAATAGPAQPAGATTPPVDPFDQALVQWRRAVTLGDWTAVKVFLAGLATIDEKKAAWQQMLNGVRNPPQPAPPAPGQGPAVHFTFEDVLGICAAAPLPRDDAAWAGLGAILQLALQRGLLLEPLLLRLREEAAAPVERAVLSRREAVKLLFAAGLRAEAGEFLPTVADAAAGKDFEALNLLAQHFVARHDKDGKSAYLEQAWAALQELFAAPAVDRKQKDEALKSAVALAPRLQQDLGKAWLDSSFTRDVQRGMDIIASIGVAAAESMQAQQQDAPFRHLTLQLQKTAVDALLAAAPERAAEWRAQLSILADNWLREANTSYQFDESSSFGPSMRRDRYGNFFYFDPEEMRQQGQRPVAIGVADVLAQRPDDRWQAELESGMRPKLAMVTAQLWLKVQEEQAAFPFIKALASSHPPQAKELVDEFLRVWTRNHDPNAGRHNYYFYGYENRADGIPLTRSKQERNLADLSRWVAELRTLPIPAPDQQLLAKAFTTCHSSAEVYRLEAIRQVFGSLEGLEPSTLAALLEQMRGNLATVWRRPDVQEKAKTRRKQKDIEAEVIRGYEVAAAVVEDGLQRHPADWSLLLARATLRHDENDFRRETGNDVKYSERRLAALGDFAAAAAAYAVAAPKLGRDQESVSPFQHWLYASLGASDLQNITAEHVPVLSEVPAIRAQLAALPGELKERHLARFANDLFTRMGGVNPAVKMRYVKAGLDIVGDQKQAFEARKLLDYYQDIVTEIRLETRVDGATTVAPGQPFGLFVEIRHTREIERESGGFGRYLRNQNDVNYSFNYGRPTENYRDKFADMAKQQLAEHFDVLSVTFQNESVHSRATEQYGWRVTPYAYVLLKPRGAQIDRVPALRLDLDFLDTSGYAVLPIESPTLPIAVAATAPARPVEQLEVTQILDERQADKGKLLLEIKATAHGLPPALDDILSLQPDGFDLAAVEDSGPQVSRFDPDGATDAIQADRTWNITLTAKPDLAERPRTFRFASARRDGIAVVRQRYADADLVAAAETVELLAEYGAPRQRWLWWALGGLAVLALGAFGLASTRRRGSPVATGLQVPDRLTPFTVIGLLRTIRSDHRLDPTACAELDAAITRIEAGFFAGDAASAPDLAAVAADWVARARERAAAG